MTLLSLDTLSKKYGALVVTDHVSLDVREGEIVGILGPNGAGKTTLFNLITGTVKPDAGRILFRGQDVTRAGAAERCKLGISRSFQVPHPFGGMTVFENILVGAAFGRAAADPESHALKVMELTAGGVPALWESSVGFRHGPKSFVRGKTDIVLLISPESPTRSSG
jgi:branched-chain amino acid transport system ATP-binding protein